MLKVLKERFKQGKCTIAYPAGDAPALPDRFRGYPAIDRSKCAENCRACEEACPVGAVSFFNEKTIQIDLGRCLFCTECTDVCTGKAISFTKNHELSKHKRDNLILKAGETVNVETGLDKKIKKIFGRSLKLRQVSAGGCNGCEADINVLSTVVYDLGRFGIQFVASPRHADGLLITGPVTENMKLALEKTYAAVPSPKLVIAAGACAISGGPYIGHREANNGADSIVPVDLFIPGCPPHPLTTLHGLLMLIKRGRNPFC